MSLSVVNTWFQYPDQQSIVLWYMIVPCILIGLHCWYLVARVLPFMCNNECAHIFPFHSTPWCFLIPARSDVSFFHCHIVFMKVYFWPCTFRRVSEQTDARVCELSIDFTGSPAIVRMPKTILCPFAKWKLVGRKHLFQTGFTFYWSAFKSEIMLRNWEWDARKTEDLFSVQEFSKFCEHSCGRMKCTLICCGQL